MSTIGGLLAIAVAEALPVLQHGGTAGWILHVLERHRQCIGGVVRQAASEHFPSQYADAVQVRTAVHLAAARLFRRHVRGTADREPGRGQSRVVATAQRDAEVGQLRALGFVEQHVLRLDVAVDHAAQRQ